MTEGAARDETLTYRGEVFVNPPSTRQWVSVKLFDLPADVDDRAALMAMIAHVRYRDSYGGTGEQDMVDIHGPYRLAAVTPETFTVADPVAAETLIRTWAGCYGPWNAADEQAMEHEVYQRIRRVTTIFRLLDLRAVAEHDWGYVVGSATGFHEYVAVDRAARELALIVASDD